MLSSTNILGHSHSYPETYVGYGLERHTYRGSDLGLSVAITCSKIVSEAGLIHFLLQYSLLPLAFGLFLCVLYPTPELQNYGGKEQLGTDLYTLAH